MTPSRTSPVVSGTFATCWTASEETWSWPWRPTTRGKLACRGRAVSRGSAKPGNTFARSSAFTRAPNVMEEGSIGASSTISARTRLRVLSFHASPSDQCATGRFRLQLDVAIPPADKLFWMVGTEMRPQAVLALQRRRRDQMAHGDHAADLQLATRPAAVFEPLFPFLQLHEGGEQPLLAPDDAHLLPHQ